MDQGSARGRIRPSRRALVALLAAAIVVVAGCDWLQPGADAGRSGFQPNETTLTAANVGGLRQLFAVPVGVAQTGFDTTPAKAGTGVFVTSCPISTCTVSRRDAVTGALVWSKNLPSGAGLDPVVSGSAVIVASGATLVAYDAETGSVRWTSNRPVPIRQLAVSGTHLVTSEAQGLDVTYASSIEVLRVADGVLEWAKDQGAWPGGFAVGDGVVDANRYGIQFRFQGVDVYDLATGTFLRNLANCPVAHVASGRIFSGGAVCDTVTGSVTWADPQLSEFAAIDPTSVLSSTTDANGASLLRRFDPATGARGWSHTLPGTGSNTQPSIANGVVYVGSYSYSTSPPYTYTRTVTAFRETDGVQLFSVTVPGSPGTQMSPAAIVAQGRVYFVAGGVLYAYGL